MGQNVRASLKNCFQGCLISPEIRNQHFHGHTGRFVSDGGDHARKLPGAAIGQVITSYRSDHRMAQLQVFHSFRHNVRTALTESRTPETTIDRILGHESGGSVGARVYTHVPIESLQSAIETLQYPAQALVQEVAAQI